MKINLEGFSKLITTVRVRYALDDATKQTFIAGSITDALVGDHIEVKVTFLENFLEELDDLKSQYVLPQVIVDFKDARDHLGRPLRQLVALLIHQDIACFSVFDVTTDFPVAVICRACILLHVGEHVGDHREGILWTTGSSGSRRHRCHSLVLELSLQLSEELTPLGSIVRSTGCCCLVETSHSSCFRLGVL